MLRKVASRKHFEVGSTLKSDVGSRMSEERSRRAKPNRRKVPFHRRKANCTRQKAVGGRSPIDGKSCTNLASKLQKEFVLPHSKIKRRLRRRRKGGQLRGREQSEGEAQSTESLISLRKRQLHEAGSSRRTKSNRRKVLY